MGVPIKVSVADRAVGMAAMVSLLDQIDSATYESTDLDGIADHILAAASKVRFQPSTRHLVLTFDLAMSGSEPGE
jgi:hypothetical protein